MENNLAGFDIFNERSISVPPRDIVKRKGPSFQTLQICETRTAFWRNRVSRKLGAHFKMRLAKNVRNWGKICTVTMEKCVS